MTDITTLPDGAPVQTTDQVMILRSGTLYAVTFTELTAGLQPTITAAAGSLLGRGPGTAGAPQSVTPGAGLSIQNAGSVVSVAATATDHLALPELSALDVNADLVVNSAGAPSRLPIALLLNAMQGALGQPVAVTAAGNSQATATLITGAWTIVTAGSGGLVLPPIDTMPAGVREVINVTGADVDLYPSNGDSFLGLAEDVAVAVPATSGGIRFFKVAGISSWVLA